MAAGLGRSLGRWGAGERDFGNSSFLMLRELVQVMSDFEWVEISIR